VTPEDLPLAPHEEGGVVEAILFYKPIGLGLDSPGVPIGRSSCPRVVRELATALLTEAENECEMWAGVDSGVAAMRTAETDRLARVLRAVMPDEAPQDGGVR
jgi:hypothetical protein